MSHTLDNPFWNALKTEHVRFSEGSDYVKRYRPIISTFAGAEKYVPAAYDELARLAAPGDILVVAGMDEEPTHPQLEVQRYGLFAQMVHDGGQLETPADDESDIVRLTEADIPQMVYLTSVAKPGPFSQRTIEFGNYYGIFQDEQLVAMAGERARTPGYAEVSAVCTLPGYEGRGYASRLINRVMRGMLEKNEVPFLHVAVQNERAISVYERYGFRTRIVLQAAFMKKAA